MKKLIESAVRDTLKGTSYQLDSLQDGRVVRKYFALTKTS